MLARRLCVEVANRRIAPSAAPAPSDDYALIRAGEVVNFFAGFASIHNRADGHFQQHVLAFATGLVRAFAVTPAALCIRD